MKEKREKYRPLLVLDAAALMGVLSQKTNGGCDRNDRMKGVQYLMNL